MSENDKEFDDVWETSLGDMKKEIKKITMKSIKKLKDKDAPKRVKSAYIFYGQAIRSKIKENNPDMKSPEIMKEIAKMWKDIKGTKKAKKYEQMAEDDKKRYEKEMDG